MWNKDLPPNLVRLARKLKSPKRHPSQNKLSQKKLRKALILQKLRRLKLKLQ